MAGSKLKVGFVLDDGLDNPDGVQQYILALGGWLSAQGHEVRYLVGETKRTDLPDVHSMSRNIAVRFNGNSLSMPLPTSGRRLRSFLKREQFDVLHIQVPYSPFMGHKLIMGADRTHTAIVGTFHIAPHYALSTVGNHLLGWWLHRSLKRFDTMLSVSPAAADFALRTFGVSSDILPNVIDYDRFHGAKPLPQYADDVPTILFLGRLVPRKGCLLLLQAVHRLSQDPDTPKQFRVVICGRGQLESKLRAYVQTHGLTEQVEFVGFVSEADKPRYYASADIAVFPSSGGESFGIVLLEAMASGRAAVLAGDNPGYRSVLSDKSELLFDPADPEVLAALLKTYLQNKELRRKIAQWGGTFAKGFDVNTVGTQLLAVYRQALHKHGNQ
jgi:phosphatidylinositol alpha-mannosyltransferase